MKVSTVSTQPTKLTERTGPEIFRFENPGDCLRGRLEEIDTTEIDGKPTLRYVVHQPEQDKLYSFLATADLKRKIRPSDVGRIIEVQFLGSDSEAEGGKFPMKRFKVLAEAN